MATEPTETPARYRAYRSCWLHNPADTRGGHEWIQELPFFADANPEFVRQMSAYLEVVMFQAGSCIMKQGDVGDRMYVLERGKVEILLGDAVVASVGGSTVLGELALLSPTSKRIATVRSADLCICHTITHGVFHMLLRRWPAETAYFSRMARQSQAWYRAKLREQKEKEGRSDADFRPQSRLMRLSQQGRHGFPEGEHCPSRRRPSSAASSCGFRRPTTPTAPLRRPLSSLSRSSRPHTPDPCSSRRASAPSLFGRRASAEPVEGGTPANDSASAICGQDAWLAMQLAEELSPAPAPPSRAERSHDRLKQRMVRMKDAALLACRPKGRATPVECYMLPVTGG